MPLTTLPQTPLQSPMQAAFAKVNVMEKPVKERVWLFVKDNPGMTSGQIANKLRGIAVGSITSSLHNLESRGMIRSELMPTGAGMVRNVSKRYYAEGDTYKLAPVIKRKKPGPKPGSKRVVKPEASNPAPREMTPAAPAPQTFASLLGGDSAKRISAIIETLTLAEMRIMYHKLGVIVGKAT